MINRYPSKLYEKGLYEMRKAFGHAADEYLSRLEKISPHFAAINVTFPFGCLYAREKQLDSRTREMITIAALTILGHSQPQLALHIKAGLKLGVTQKEIIEIITQMSAYGGFPAATNAMFTAHTVFETVKKEKYLHKKSASTKKNTTKK